MNILSKLPTGHYIVSALKPEEELLTRNRDYLAAGTVNWVTRISNDPAMIAVAIDKQSDLCETIEKSKGFTLHVLGEGQENMVSKFAEDSTFSDGKVNGIPFHKDENDQLIVEGTMGHLSCDVTDRAATGDHILFYGEVKNHQLNKDGEALTSKETELQYI